MPLEVQVASSSMASNIPPLSSHGGSSSCSVPATDQGPMVGSTDLASGHTEGSSNQMASGNQFSFQQNMDIRATESNSTLSLMHSTEGISSTNCSAHLPDLHPTQSVYNPSVLPLNENFRPTETQSTVACSFQQLSDNSKNSCDAVPCPRQSSLFEQLIHLRKRGKRGPDSRLAPMDESPVTTALRTSISRPGEPIFQPHVGMQFNSVKDAKDFYNLYSWEIGFGIRKGRNHTNGNKYTTRQDLVCSCEGISPNQAALSFRTGCKAMVRLHRTSEHAWIITLLVLDHNHPCSSTYGENKQWPSHSEIDPMTKDMVQKLHENNIPKGRVCSILGVHESQPAHPIQKEVVRSLCARLSQESIKDDLVKTMNLLQVMKSNDIGMEVRFAVDDDGKIKSMLWCTGKNRTDYAQFGDVVTFDTTYRTNLYNLPFGLFVGVNNHFQSIVYGGVLLTNERTEDFEWAFTNFIQIMAGKQPVTILTDQCAAIAAAIKSTMNGTAHRWCRWHVLRKAKQKVGPKYSKHSTFKKEFNKLVTEETNITKFEKKWKQIIQKYNLQTNKFLLRIYNHRAMWAKPYFMKIFCAGMTSTQRSESANHMLKLFIQSSATMHTFVQKFNEFLSEEVHLTKQIRRKQRVGVPIERHAEQIYTRRMYDKFYNELYESGGFVIKNREVHGTYVVAHSCDEAKPDHLSYTVRYNHGDKVSCDCGFFDHMGMLCRHSLKVLVNLDVMEIPAQSIMTRWMKVEPSLAGSDDQLNKYLLIRRVVEVTSASTVLSSAAFTQAMAAMDSVSTTHQNAVSCEQASTVKSNHDSMLTVSCPGRMTKKGRPPNSSLQSREDEQKRKKREPTDEKAPRVAKTRLLSDVL